jgi:ABC-2 type transport system permease protein
VENRHSIAKLKLVVGFLDIILFLGCLAAGLVLFMAFEVLFSCMVIVFVHLGRLFEIVNYLSRFGEYPLDIYSNVTRLIFITVVPFAVWVHIPAKILLGSLDYYMLYSLVFCFLFFLGSLKLWDICLKRYTSAGG